MKSVIGNLRVNLGLDSASFDKGLDKAETRLGRARNRFTSIAAGLGRIALPLAAAGAAVGVGASRMAAGITEIENQARVAGISVERFQAMSAATETVGISQEKLADILKDVNDRVGDFLQTGGGPMADFFEKIAPKVGITADAFRDLNSAEALQLFVSSLEKAGVSQQEMTFYMEAMASDATALIPLLRDNGKELNRLADEAERFGTYTQSAADDARAFQEGLADIQRALGGLGTALANSGFLGLLAQGLEFAADELTNFVQMVRDAVSAAKEMAEGIKGAFDGLPAAFEGIGEAAIEGLIRGLGILSPVTYIRNLGSDMITAFKSVLGIQSPSREFRDLGGYLMEGLQLGIDDGALRVNTSMQDLTTDLKGAFRGLIFEGQSFRKTMAGLLGGWANRLETKAVDSLFSAFIPGFANGTNFAPGGLAVVGERGPELVNLPRGSQVIPNHQLGGGSMNVGIGFDPSMGSFVATMRDETGRMIGQALTSYDRTVMPQHLGQRRRG